MFCAQVAHREETPEPEGQRLQTTRAKGILGCLQVSVLNAVAEERRDLSTHRVLGASSQPVPLSQVTHPLLPFCSLSHSKHSPEVVPPSNPLMCCCSLSTGAGWTLASPQGDLGSTPDQHHLETRFLMS